MKVNLNLSCFLYIHVIFCLSLIEAQQPYIRKDTTKCNSKDNSTSVLGYTCNGVNRSCQAYLSFRSEPPYDSVSSISNLVSAEPSKLAQLNSVGNNARFERNKMVLVPVKCSCSGEQYQSNASYVVAHQDTYFVIANNTYQSLTTCQALRAQNNLRTRKLYSGTRLTIPLRCACPTKNQSDAGVKFLLTYLIKRHQYVSLISSIFGVDPGMTLEANGLSEDDTIIYPFTTLLVPLQTPPLSSQLIEPPPPPRPPPPPQSSPSSSNPTPNRTWLYVVIALIAGFALATVLGLAIFCCFFRSKVVSKKEPIIGSQRFEAYQKPEPAHKKWEEEPDFLDTFSSIAQSLKVYTFEELKSATLNFSPNCLMNESVYRGTINGDFAAIKKMNGDVSKEIKLLNKINHFNLILLSGVCFNEGNWYLVYEYAENGPLSDWIYYNSSGQHDKFLNWAQRIQIGLDVATGLNYLHSYTSPPYVHKDLKASNVLLDSDFRAKITNFTLARSAQGRNGEFALTSHIVGTKGYMAPEYLENGMVSSKLDVYAFGVVMLEMLTGKDIFALYEGVKAELSEVLIPVLEEEDGKENLSNFIDPSLKGGYPTELAIMVVRMIDGCLKKDPPGRPDMNEILQCLSRITSSSMLSDFVV